MSGITVKDIARRLISYANYAVGDTYPTGLAQWVEDSIKGAIGEIKDVAPGMFDRLIGGILSAPKTISATMTPSTPTVVTLSASGIVPNDNCTVRIGGVPYDMTIYGVSSTTGTITPGWSGETVGSQTFTVWHDSFQVSDGGPAVSDVGFKVRVNGVQLARVATREQAEARCGWDNIGQQQVLRLATQPNQNPEVWWLEQRDRNMFVMVYPMPSARMGIEVTVHGGMPVEYANPESVFTDTYDGGFSDDVARNAWRPLATLRFSASPFFANAGALPEVQRQAQVALDSLKAMQPKRGRMPDWNESRQRKVTIRNGVPCSW